MKQPKITVTSGEINLQSKHDLICRVAKVKAATSAHSMADIMPFFSVLIIPFESNALIKPKKIYFTLNKENSIRNIVRVLMFQQLLANKHHRLRDSKWPRKGLGLVANKKNNKPHAEQELCSAHGRVVNN